MTPEQKARRKMIMGRSMRLGHCVCDPQKPCPCPLFKEKNVCECAGERVPVPDGQVRLTEHVRNAGCASKIGRKDLTELLSGLPQISDPRVVVGSSSGDDAGVIKLSDDVATILTVDVFAPCVDDPYTFGQIAAANSVSDIYAMGATPQTALSIVGFPVHSLPIPAMNQMLRGGLEKMAEAGVSVIGGHSINDEEAKFGFAVVGTALQNGYVTNSGAQAGDAIVLTKPLGVGIITFARQVGRAPAGAVEQVTASMSALNKAAGEGMREYGAHAATDVTGFSLMGHMSGVVTNSSVKVEIDFDALPFFDGVAELARAEVLPGALERNREAVSPELLDLDALAAAQQSMLFCPETSGGLLVFLPAEKAADYVAAVKAGGAEAATVIGRVCGEHPGGLIKVLTARAAEFSALEPSRPAAAATATAALTPPVDASCCAPAAGGDAGSPGSGLLVSPASSDAFAGYMQAVNAPGALGAKEKKLIALALSVVGHCEACVKINTNAAREAGASDAELSEAVALGISFGGAPTNMFYSALK
jgi:selenide, water dikinase